jgi:hypothetical protein
MAYVGAVYTIAPHVRTVEDVVEEVNRRAREGDRPRPQNKRVWAEMTQIVEGKVREGPSQLFSELAFEAAQRGSGKRWVCLMDGQASLWTQKNRRLASAVGILDVFHVMERLWHAAYCFYAESSVEAEEFVEHYLRMLLEGKVGYVIGVFGRLKKKRRLRGGKRKSLEKVICYFETNKAYMRYDEYLAAGYPIGSGVVEGACRHFVKDRMELSGMRWEIEGAQAILDLRSTYLNGEWDSFIDYRIQREQTELYGSKTGKNTEYAIAG